MLAGLRSSPTTELEMDLWATHNWTNHVDITRLIRQDLALALPLYPIYPMPTTPDQFENWSNLHQQLHSAMTSALGIAGSNFENFDLLNPDDRDTWIALHFAEHQQASQILGLG